MEDNEYEESALDVVDKYVTKTEPNGNPGERVCVCVCVCGEVLNTLFAYIYCIYRDRHTVSLCSIVYCIYMYCMYVCVCVSLSE